MYYLEPAFSNLPAPFDVHISLLHENLKELSYEAGPVLQQARKALEYIRSAFSAVRQEALNGFLSEECNEICFFKQIKPSFYSLLKFWKEVYSIEWHRPGVEGAPARQYLQRRLELVGLLFEDHREFLSYYLNGETALDDIYFLRKNKCRDAYIHCVDCEQGDSLYTSRDALAADLLAGRFLEEYLKSEIRGLDADNQLPVLRGGGQADTLQWTASKAAITELIYALNEYGAFGNSSRQLRKVSQYFCQMFSIEIPNIYKVYEENRKRKKCRTPFLDGLKISLTRKMELDDMNLSGHR